MSAPEVRKAMADAAFASLAPVLAEGAEPNPDDWAKAIDALLRAAEEAGWRLVPRRATNAMLDAVDDLVSYPEEVWTAMLAAAPKVGGSDA